MVLTQKAAHYKRDLASEMKAVSDKYGVGYGKQVSDFIALRRAGTGLSFQEYINYRLFSQSREQYDSYMGNDRAYAAFLIANQLTSWDAAEDKLFFSTLVSNAGLPTPSLLAFYHRSRDAAGARALRNVEDIVDFLRGCSAPVFGKPAIGAHGNNTMMIVGCEGGSVEMGDGERASVDAVAQEVVEASGRGGFLFQHALRPHRDIAALTQDRLATARFLVMIDGDEVKLRHCVIRLPAEGHFVDSFQRPGNLISPVDLGNGVLGVARRDLGAHSEEVSVHPNSNIEIDGYRLPDFDDAKRLLRKAALIYPGLRLQSWDVAFTDSGPSLVEVNPGGNFLILQVANGRGVFDEEFRVFLEDCLRTNPGAKSNGKAYKDATKLLKLKNVA